MRTVYRTILITILSVILSVTMVACGSVDSGSTDNLGDDLQSGTVDLGSANIGDYVTFGHYEQDNNLENGKEPIEWKVLDKTDGRVLLLSKYGLDTKLYNDDYTRVTWETCTLRSWLNSEFLNTAFSSSEKSAIPTVNLSNPNNPNYGTAGGNDTKDQVFLLSLQEMQQYFNLSDTWTDYNGNNNDITGEIYYSGGSKDVITSPTAYAVAQGAHADSVYHDAEGKGSCFWWLRSPGHYGLDVAYVYYYGTVDASGYSVDFDSGAVRPALWFDNAQKGNTGPESSHSEKSSNQEMISEQEAMDIAYITAMREYGNVEVTDEEGNPVEGMDITYDVGQPIIYERDDKNHTVTISILVMMKINGEGNSGTFQYYVVDMKTGNCSKEDMYE